MEIAKIIVGIVHIILSVLIIALILLQSGKQAGLSGAVAGAGESFFGKNKGRTLDAVFSKFTKICAIGFLCTSLFLAYSYAIGDKVEAPEVTDPIVTMEPVEGEGVPEGEVAPEAEVVEGETAPETAVPTATPATPAQ